MPKNIALDELPGPRRGEYPAQFFRDEVIWSPERTHLALAYTIHEASMCNEVGYILWASVDGSNATILQNPEGVMASCWRSPWCRWLAEDTFVFKAQRFNGKTVCTPLVAVHVTDGFQVLSGTDSPKQWFEDIPCLGGEWTSVDADRLLTHITECP